MIFSIWSLSAAVVNILLALINLVYPCHCCREPQVLHSLIDEICAGPAAGHDMRAVIAYAPNTSSEQAIMSAFMRSVACPDDPSKKLSYSDSFYTLFRQPLDTPECADQMKCLADAACSSHLGDSLLSFSGRFASQSKQIRGFDGK